MPSNWEENHTGRMVGLRKRRQPQLDYCALHKYGKKRKLDRTSFKLTQDHEYCMKPSECTNFQPVEEMSDARLDEIDFWKSHSLDTSQMKALLGPNLSNWEKDPDLAGQLQSLGDVLGLARDLNISIDGFDWEKKGSDTSVPPDSHPDGGNCWTEIARDVTSGAVVQEERRNPTEFNARRAIEHQSKCNGKASGARKQSKRGRKPAKIDVKAKLERSRQSARECRARKKLRYQYLEELVASRERAVFQLRGELEQFKKWAADIDNGTVPSGLEEYLERERERKERSQSESSVNSYVIRSRRRLTTDRTESESSVASSCLSVQSVQSPPM